MKNLKKLLALLFIVGSAVANAQFSGPTNYFASGASLPALCSGPEVFTVSIAGAQTPYYCSAANTWTQFGAESGSGTVTSVSVTTANGVSGTVATATTTPAITLTLGAITPTSVTLNAATGTGIINIPSGTTTANGVWWGTDACLYRSTTATLAVGCGATAFSVSGGTIIGTDYDASTTGLTGQVSLGGAHVASGVYLNYATANANPAVVIRQGNAGSTGDILDLQFSTTIRSFFNPAGAFIQGATKFTTSGCSVSSTTGAGAAGKFTLGANTCSVVITINGATAMAAPNGWSCNANDETTAAGNTGLYFSANNTTTATLVVPATAGTTDVIDFGCQAF